MLLMLLVAEQWDHQLQESLVELCQLLLSVQAWLHQLVELELEVACAGHWSWS